MTDNKSDSDARAADVLDEALAGSVAPPEAAVDDRLLRLQAEMQNLRSI